MTEHNIFAEQAGESMLSAAVEAQEYNLVSILGLAPQKDGEVWCVLWGENPHVGISGFGTTPYQAVLAFNRAVHNHNGLFLKGHTMTRKEALEALLVKVEAGECLFPSDFPPLFKAVPRALAAHEGSLDAAKALDKALPTNAVMPDNVAIQILFGRNGARTWLAHKIKGLIAMEGEE